MWKGSKDSDRKKEQAVLLGSGASDLKSSYKLSTTPSPASHAQVSSKHTYMGKNINIKGELFGNEDLEVEGRINGKINLPECTIAIGEEGQVNAEIVAKTVNIHGKLTGNILASEKVEIHGMGFMEGDIISPRIQIVDGAQFKGSIDTQKAKEKKSVESKEPMPSGHVSVLKNTGKETP